VEQYGLAVSKTDSDAIEQAMDRDLKAGAIVSMRRSKLAISIVARHSVHGAGDDPHQPFAKAGGLYCGR